MRYKGLSGKNITKKCQRSKLIKQILTLNILNHLLNHRANVDMIKISMFSNASAGNLCRFSPITELVSHTSAICLCKDIAASALGFASRHCKCRLYISLSKCASLILLSAASPLRTSTVKHKTEGPLHETFLTLLGLAIALDGDGDAEQWCRQHVLFSPSSIS